MRHFISLRPENNLSQNSLTAENFKHMLDDKNATSMLIGFKRAI